MKDGERAADVEFIVATMACLPDYRVSAQRAWRTRRRWALPLSLALAMSAVLTSFLASERTATAQTKHDASAAAVRTTRKLSGRLPGRPAYLWLWYADGGRLPEDEQTCGALPPPTAYQCSFGDTNRDCQAQVQRILDDWYRDFNLVFTFDRPPSGDYYTVVIASGWPACKLAAADVTGGAPLDEAGIAAGNCNDNPGLAAIAIECGRSALACATIIAHEHGHLLGLEHTSSRTDIMNASVLPTVSGFDDQANVTVNGTCQPKQNSYRQTLAALGPWVGGPKTSPLGGAADAGIVDAAAAADAPAGGSIGPSPVSIHDGSTSFVGGEDALVRPTIPRADAAPAASGSRGGCDVSAAACPHAPVLAVTLFIMPFLIVAVWWRRRLADIASRRRG